MWPSLHPQPHLALKTNVSLRPDWLYGPACPIVHGAQSVQCLDERLSPLLYSGREQYLKPLGRHYTAERRIKGQEMQHRQLLTNGAWGGGQRSMAFIRKNCKLSCLLRHHTWSICAQILHACTIAECNLKQFFFHPVAASMFCA